MEERRRVFKEAFAAINGRVGRFHVHTFDHYARSLEAAALVPTVADVPLLAELARDEKTGLALLLLGDIDHPSALEAVLACPPLHLGERGDPGLEALTKLARANPRHRDALAEALRRGLAGPSVHRAATALLATRDPRAVPFVVSMLGLLEKDLRGEGTGIRAHHLLELVRAAPDPAYAEGLERILGLEALLEDMWGLIPTLVAALAACGRDVKERLWGLLDAADVHAANYVVECLAPLVDARDTKRVLAVIAPPRWKAEAFYARLHIVTEVDPSLLGRAVRDALLEIVEKARGSDLLPEIALDGLDRCADPLADLPRLEKLYERSPGRADGHLMRSVARRKPDPVAFLTETLAHKSHARRRVVGMLIRVDASSSPPLPVARTSETWCRLGRAVMRAIDEAKDVEEADELQEALHGLVGRVAAPRYPSSEEERAELRAFLERRLAEKPSERSQFLIPLTIKALSGS